MLLGYGESERRDIMRKIVTSIIIILSFIVLLPQMVFAQEGRWIQSDGRWWYQYSDGSYPANEWLQVDGSWYHFDSSGWMQTGWIYTGGYYYYLNSSGDMKTDTFADSNAVYKFRSSGELIDTKLSVIRESQMKSNWCWAASSAVVAKYNNNTGITQYNIVNHVKGSEVNEGGSANEERRAINYASNYNKNAYIGTQLKFEKIRQLIDKQKPFVMNVKWLSQDNSVWGWISDFLTYKGHAVVIAGYNLDNRTVWIVDPWSNTSTNSFSYDKLRDGERLNTGYGKYFNGVYY